MNGTEKLIKSLQEMRDETALRAERAAREAESTQKQLKSLDTALAALIDDGATGLRVPVAKTGQFGDAEIRDAAVYAAKDKNLDFAYEDLVTQNEFLASIANPVTRARNLRNLWEDNLNLLIRSEGSDPQPAYIQDYDIALNIAQNKSKDTGLALTTVNVAHTGQEQSVTVHVMRNNKSDKTLIVGESIPSKLRDAFRKANIHYVDRKAPDAKAQIKTALKDVLGPTPPRYIEERLVDAFKYRNMAEKIEDEKGVDFVSALVDPKFEASYPKFVVRPK